MDNKNIMKKNKLIEIVQKKYKNLSKKEINDIIDIIFNSIVENCLDGKIYTQNNFGRFEHKIRAERKGRNKVTGEIIDIPEAHVIKFYLSKTLFKKLNNKK